MPAQHRIPDKFLDELRAALPVSTVVGRRVKLIRAGSEFKALSPFNKEKTPSFTVTDEKGFWHDFSSGKTGDIFAFEMAMTGCTFMDAVNVLAPLAGMTVPGAPAKPRTGSTTPAPQQPDSDDPGPQHPDTGGQANAPPTERKITKTYDYTDADGGLVYQVCRLEWTDGEDRKKTFLQRRPADGDPGHWVWGLSAGDFLQGRNGDWYQATKKRIEAWRGAPRKTFPDEVAHGLYRFAALREEMAQHESERRTIFVVEGEKDADTLTDWGLVATTTSGGARNWRPHHAQEFRGADVVVLLDNDKAGREGGHKKATSLRGIALRVRVVDWREHWPTAPDKADVTDWANHGAGTEKKLWAVVDKLTDWTPQPPESSFNAVRFVDLDRPARELEWLVKKVMTRGEVSMWYGAPGCGKSFLITSAGLSVARGISWFGMRVRQGLVVYQAGEGGLGLRKRLRAYRRHHNIRADENLPFVLLPRPVNLYVDDADVNNLITEIKAWASFYDAPLELVVIDTFSAASPGADENASKDVSPVLHRCHRIAIETGAHVALVHHTPKAGGSPRGWSGLTGNIENAIEVIRTEQVDQEISGADGHRILRDIREFVTTKQKDDEDKFRRAFVLKQVVLGRDLDDDLITSCVIHPLQGVAEVASANAVPQGYANLKPNNLVIFKALNAAIRERGVRAPQDVNAPEMTLCIKVGDWNDFLVERHKGHEAIDEKLLARVKKQIQRACEQWNDQGINLIGKDKEWVWRTTRKVHQVDEPPVRRAQRPEEPMLMAPGDDTVESL